MERIVDIPDNIVVKNPTEQQLYRSLWGLPVFEEIIRCKDCGMCTETIKYADGEAGARCEVVPFCERHRRETEPGFFCSWAVRMA